jgi:photosystem II stability/assembly factor-like uncharacterized protein
MKKLLLCLTLVGLLALALGGTAGAKSATVTSFTNTVAGADPSLLRPVWAARADVVSPTVSAVEPSSASNDIGTPVTITGADFTAEMDGTGTIVLTPPKAFLGGTALTHVNWVDSTTLTAAVPWGVDPGTYPLTVVNPDGGSGSRASAFTVTQGLGKWNAGDLFGGVIDQLLMKPEDPNTIYARAFDIVGLLRSDDAGEHWAFVSDKAWANGNDYATDPNNPDWLYAFAPNGLMRSTDEGDTWATLPMGNKWPDGRDVNAPQVYVSPHDPQVLFISSSSGYGGADTGAMGLIKSTTGGATWSIETSMEGIPVQDVAFHPTDPLKMVLVTSDGRVFQSADGGDTWNVVTKPLITSLGLRGSITYNPYRPSEVWVSSRLTPDAIYKSTEPAFAAWQDVSPPSGPAYPVSFTAADSVYIPRFHSTDGGLNWSAFGPSPWLGGESGVLFDPTDSRIAYIGNDAVGVQKTTDGGLTWQAKIQGLTAMSCTTMDVSRADPLRVYATFNGPQGIYRSDDGTSHWTYLPIADAWNVRQVLDDPLDPQHVYVAADSGFFASSDGGDTWSDLGWNVPAPSPEGMPNVIAADPYQSGRLLVAFDNGTYGIGTSKVFSSDDQGRSWQPVSVLPGQDVAWITSIVFDPETAGTVYLTTGGTGVYKSTEHGASGSWTRIDDTQQPEMATAAGISIATHPQDMLLVGLGSAPAYRSLDGGGTWVQAQSFPSGGSEYMFADGDSSRLYAATWIGLWFSSDAGDSWERAAGAFGRIQISAVRYAHADGHTILYAATNGGGAGAAASSSAASGPRRVTLATTTASTVVDPGIYRYVVVTPRMTLKLSGLSGGAMRLGRRVTARGAVTPTSLAGAKVNLTFQKKRSGRWVTLKRVARTISVKGVYSWPYKPATRGAYRVRAGIAKTANHMAAGTAWRSFKVK